MGSKVYIRLDGDDIGNKIELLLLNENYKKAQNVHNTVQVSMKMIREKIKRITGAEIMMYGSDDILFTLSDTINLRKFLEEIRKDFFKDTESTLSIGVGNTTISSMNNLRRAKLSGKNRIEEERTTVSKS